MNCSVGVVHNCSTRGSARAAARFPHKGKQECRKCMEAGAPGCYSYTHPVSTAEWS